MIISVWINTLWLCNIWITRPSPLCLPFVNRKSPFCSHCLMVTFDPSPPAPLSSFDPCKNYGLDVPPPSVELSRDRGFQDRSSFHSCRSFVKSHRTVHGLTYMSLYRNKRTQAFELQMLKYISALERLNFLASVWPLFLRNSFKGATCSMLASIHYYNIKRK